MRSGNQVASLPVQHCNAELAGFIHAQPLETDGALTERIIEDLWQGVHRQSRLETKLTLGKPRRVTPAILCLKTKLEALTGPAQA